ncbi:flagellar hook-basal body protein [Paenibacillus athensensis]|uniref:Flagellar biosynthesis protein FlgG n=1 Tax=Paenibacillus athensensis TaxID=1967502 RepID=A0A4Y8Q4G6_9BACL|nr:flagellar hook-basal body protein [Paenibacillus athensensis]MCD1260871.1 flagellar hook-basal body protein [Paenibacillus athensensis]
MNNSMINSSVSMQSLQQKLDILANNIANANTTGFKKKEASFEDVLTNVKGQPEGFRQQGRMSPLGFNQGWGAKLVQIQTNMAQGPVQATGNQTDLAIQGDGLFEVTVNTVDANGNPVQQPAWTRNGAFHLSPDTTGNMVMTTEDGHFLAGTDGNPIRLPKNYRPAIDPDGRILAYNEIDHNQPPINVGQIKLVRVVRPQLLREVGDNLYSLPAGVTNIDGILQNVNGTAANAADRVEVMQGYLEQSNVQLADEMTELVMVQKAFQLNSRAITSSDTMMNLANNLRG